MGAILGLDLSLTSTGVGFREWNEATDAQGMKSERWTVGAKLRGAERLNALHNLLEDRLRHTQPEYAFIEGYSFASKNSRAHSTGEWGGVARLKLYWQGVDYFEVPPATLKKFITGKHNAKKPEMVMNLLKRWGLEFPQEDEADAVSLVLFGEAFKHPRTVYPDLKQFQIDAVEKYREALAK